MTRSPSASTADLPLASAATGTTASSSAARSSPLAGTWMQNIALAWLVIELSGSALAVGALAFCRFLPFLAFGLVAGVVVDRFDSRRLLVVTQRRRCSCRSRSRS